MSSGLRRLAEWARARGDAARPADAPSWLGPEEAGAWASGYSRAMHDAAGEAGAPAARRTVDLNRRVRARVRGPGRLAWRRHHEALGVPAPELGEYWEGELWELAQIWGGHMYAGGEPPVEPELEVLP